MQFKQDAKVLSWKGEQVGSIDRVVVDPETNQITHVVIKKGWLFSEDKVVPINHVIRATEDAVRIKISDDQLDNLPDFIETEYVILEDNEAIQSYKEGMARPVFWYPPAGGTAWFGSYAHGGYLLPVYVKKTTINIPAGAITIKEGAKVLSRDDQDVGEVESIITDPDTEQVTHLLITRGFISKERKMIPSIWIGMVIDDDVHLTVKAEIIERLPEYELTKG